MSKTPAYRYKAICQRVVDGDTYVLDIDLGFEVRAAITVRLRGVDTPEMNTPAGPRAKAFVDKLLDGAALIVETQKNRDLSDRMTFARYVADVWLEDGRRLADVLLKAGHAVPLVIP